ncbi:MAG: hypothetical protein ABFS19_10780 [Thermodesulfobacteriota bacterium]
MSPHITRVAFLVCLLLTAVSACSSKPVRHLASDVCLIKAGETDRASVIRFLGEPNSKRKLSATREEWLYYEEKKSTMQKIPLMGEAFEGEGYQVVKIIIEGDTVLSSDFTTTDDTELPAAGKQP